MKKLRFIMHEPSRVQIHIAQLVKKTRRILLGEKKNRTEFKRR